MLSILLALIVGVSLGQFVTIPAIKSCSLRGGLKDLIPR